MSRPKKKANLVTGQQTLSLTQTREKPQENDAGRAIEIDDTGKEEKNDLMTKMCDLKV